MEGCRNLLFLCADAAKIDNYFSAGEVSKNIFEFFRSMAKGKTCKRRHISFISEII